MADRGGHTTYPECKQFPRAHFEDSPEVQAYAMSKDKNILPLYERIMSDYKRMKLNSLEGNELLKCRWNSYVHNTEHRTFSPFPFPGVGDLHFHNCEVKFMPSLSPKNRKNLRMQMGPGPGVDNYGQMPIPHDMFICEKETNKTVASTKVKKK